MISSTLGTVSVERSAHKGTEGSEGEATKIGESEETCEGGRKEKKPMEITRVCGFSVKTRKEAQRGRKKYPNW